MMGSMHYLFIGANNDLLEIKRLFVERLTSDLISNPDETKEFVLTKNLTLWFKKSVSNSGGMFDDPSNDKANIVASNLNFAPTAIVTAEFLEDGHIHFLRTIIEIVTSTDWNLVAEIWGIPMLVRVQGKLRVNEQILGNNFPISIEEMLDQHHIKFEAANIKPLRESE